MKYYFSLILMVSIFIAQPVSAANDVDTDKDGLSDKFEQRFKTDVNDPDSDGDGYGDGQEVMSGYDPLKSGGSKLEKIIKIDLKKQELQRTLGGVVLETTRVSTGKPGMYTPRGAYKIKNKAPRPWSKAYGLWMPYWLGIEGQRFGLHELPEWPGGKKEGADHLGKPVSHGCIRLGVGPAKTLYDWTEVGVKVVIN